MNVSRYVIHPHRGTGYYILDAITGETWCGFTYIGATQYIERFLTRRETP